MAEAQRAEEARLLANPGPSQLATKSHYDSWLGDFDLVDPVEHPVDKELSALCQIFATANAARRSEIRDSASMDDFYALLNFARRSAVFAIRDRDPHHLIDGFTSIAMIERARIDFRDALVALSLLHHAVGVLRLTIADFFENAALLAERGMSELILLFVRQSADYQDIRKSWGYTTIQTHRGPGFVGWEFKSYEPTYPLDQIAMELAQLVKRDKYGPGTITLASDIPATWLSSVNDQALKDALSRVRAVVTVRADLRPEQSPDYKSQFLLIFIAELSDEASADALLKLSQEKQSRPNDFALASVRHSRLFCIAIGRSFEGGKACFETQASIQRFAPSIGEILKSQA